MLENTPNLYLWKDEAIDILPKNSHIVVKTKMGIEIKAKAVIVTAGTFLNGKNIYRSLTNSWRKTWRTCSCRIDRIIKN